MNRLWLLGVWLLAAYSGLAQSSQINKEVQHFVADSCFKGASIGLVVADFATKETLASYNADLALTPASCQKLITSATVLDLLGENYQFKTTVGISGAVKKGVLNGNLIIKGFGDPTLQSKYFKADTSFASQLVAILKEQHISAIKGKVIVDTSYFSATIPRTWIWEDIGNYYGAVPHAINYCDNLYTLCFQSKKADENTIIKRTIPQQTGLTFVNHVKGANNKKDLAYIFGGNTSTQRRIEGTIPQYRSCFKVKGALLHPEICLINDVKAALAKSNIAVQGDDIHTKEKRLLHTFYSPNIGQVIQLTNKKSINLFADNLLFAIAKNQYQIANWDNGCKAIINHWKNKGINTNTVRLLDGSGLSHFNAVSANFFTQILFQMRTNLAFTSSLAVAGKSGTLKYFGKDSTFGANFIAKTGSMTGVQCYSGYLTCRSGKRLTVTILINNFFCERKTVQQRVAYFIEKLYHSSCNTN